MEADDPNSSTLKPEILGYRIECRGVGDRAVLESFAIAATVESARQLRLRPHNYLMIWRLAASPDPIETGEFEDLVGSTIEALASELSRLPACDRARIEVDFFISVYHDEGYWYQIGHAVLEQLARHRIALNIRAYTESSRRLASDSSWREQFRGPIKPDEDPGH